MYLQFAKSARVCKEYNNTNNVIYLIFLLCKISLMLSKYAMIH